MAVRLKIFYNFQLVRSDFSGVLDQPQAMIVRAGRIQWIGPQKELPRIKGKATQVIKVTKVNLKQQKVLPSFIECHTHTVFAGSRADEFERRNQGVSYLEIAARGGGILSTVKKTRDAAKKELLKLSQERVNHFLRQGVSTLEVKSGYGLNTEAEIKILEVARALKGPRIVTTFLGAHAKPREAATYDSHLDDLLKNTLPLIKKKKLSQRVDIFIEEKFFEAQSAKNYLKKFQEQGFDVAIHANQLSASGGAALAIELKARSADHVIHLSDQDIKNFAQSNTVAVLLPAADLYMQCPYPPARALIDAGATVALATDFNPGSCPTQDLMLVGLLARLQMKMSLPEVFQAYTIHAAKALGIETEEGTLEKGKWANFICTEAELTDFFYSAGQVPPHCLFIRGNAIRR